jgi:hypothetical protein
MKPPNADPPLPTGAEGQVRSPRGNAGKGRVSLNTQRLSLKSSPLAEEGALPGLERTRRSALSRSARVLGSLAPVLVLCVLCSRGSAAAGRFGRWSLRCLRSRGSNEDWGEIFRFFF